MRARERASPRSLTCSNSRRAMEIIRAILFEPVGCLAEFAPEEFREIALNLFHRSLSPGISGSDAYWHLLSVMETDTTHAAASNREIIEEYESRAASRARPYEDVIPSLSELKALGIELLIASSLSTNAVIRFLSTHSLGDFFSDVWSRDRAGGVKHVPLVNAVTDRALEPARVMFITDTAGGLEAARHVGVNAILMMNDPDEAMKLTTHGPAGGIVSLHELPDFIRLVSAENARPTFT
jgi:phosphoglycolate phosphatase-like HAD superfamily hydrolase